jgi:23S rRNA (adenine2503-C2)-methyltransferase
MAKWPNAPPRATRVQMESPVTTQSFGLTFAEFCVGRRGDDVQLRREYAALMRAPASLGCAPLRITGDEGVRKFCLNVGPGSLETESVIIPMRSHRGSEWNTLCVSSQVGCRMGCTFCETGRMGLLRNLEAHEIVLQRLAACQVIAPDGCTTPYVYDWDGIHNMVFMGMGEPFDNLDNVLQALRVLSDPRGIGFPLSQITVSTVGRIDGLRALAERIRAGETHWQKLRLAVSLNAANDELRDQLVPINKGMPLADLQRALIDYPFRKRDLFLIEYVMLDGVNTALEHADQIAAWCKPFRCVVNLIPYNHQSDSPYVTPSEETIYAFFLRLRAHGVFVKRRITQGRDLRGACGQLGNPELRARRMHLAI